MSLESAVVAMKAVEALSSVVVVFSGVFAVHVKVKGMEDPVLLLRGMAVLCFVKFDRRRWSDLISHSTHLKWRRK